MIEIIVGDALTELRKRPSDSVHCCVTSPPYFGLRDYGVVGQIGLERTPNEFVAVLVEVFREVRRVLREDGTLWLNLGDSYAGSWGAQGRRGPESKNSYNESIMSRNQIANHPKTARNTGSIRQDGLKPKDLIGIPWRVAFALQADGWYLRQDIIWSKPNPMPESVQDRCTKAHEYIFLMSKSQRYHYDAEAVKESAVGLSDHDLTGQAYHAPGQPQQTGSRAKGNAKTFRGGGAYTGGQIFDNSTTADRQSHGNIPNETGLRNKRSVWTVATAPFSEAHFATFPPALIEPCILAGTPAGGTVLDPFGGAGTTGLVADRIQRDALLIELNPDYAAMARRRIDDDAGLFARAAE